MLKKLSVLPQYIAPQRALTRFAGWCGECRWPWLKNILIRYFIRRYQVDVNAATSADLADYPCFNSFFTRTLKPELRPIVQGANAIASPADGVISQIGDIRDDKLYQAKGFRFSLADLLGGSEAQARAFRDGSFATIYLSPKDYHRVHMPFTGRLRETVYIPGKLFSVNQKTAQAVSGLFARNERLVCFFETEHGPMAVILVGAMLVGGIQTRWGDPSPSKRLARIAYTSPALSFERGAEIGHFRMGSTVIVLFPSKKMQWAEGLQANSTVQMGQLLGDYLS
jgi:phosphatidylserine decarboxylase